MAKAPGSVDVSQHDFIGRLNFANSTMTEQDREARKTYMKTRFNLQVRILDQRFRQGVMETPVDSTAALLDGPGFLLVRSPSKVSDWSDPSDIVKNYYPEVQRLMHQLLPGAVKIPELQSHTTRNEDIKEHSWKDGIQYGPCANGVHNDYADFVEDGRTVKRFAEVMGMPSDKFRVVGINIWRATTPAPLKRWPLAVCDRTSIDLEDLEYNLNVNAPKPFNAHFCKPNTSQRWGFFSDMTRDEALVFLTYDSHPSDAELFRPTLHTAVDRPGSKDDPMRTSCEVRFFAYLPLPKPACSRL